MIDRSFSLPTPNRLYEMEPLDCPGLWVSNFKRFGFNCNVSF